MSIYAFLLVQTNSSDWQRGCDPLTPDDIAEMVVFACSRRENVVIAESVLLPTYQVSGLEILPVMEY